MTRFVALRIHAGLALPAGGNEEQAKRLLQQAQKGCLVTSSRMASSELEAEVMSG